MRYALMMMLCTSAHAADLRPLFDAIRQVETGGQPNCGRDSVGDGGASVGPYQIQRPYWQDSGVPGRYEQVRDRAYAERVMCGYWRRYCPAALKRGDYETLARCHNSGPGWRTKRSKTNGYWRKVKRAMETAR